MSIGSIRGVVRDGSVVLLGECTPLTEGTEVLVTPLTGKPGYSDAVLAAAAVSPKVPVEWVDELENLIAQGRRPPTRNQPFPEELASQERP